MSGSGVSVSFSTDFISHVRTLYLLALRHSLSGKVVVSGLNAYTHLAGPAYISSVAAVEAFLNEVAFGPGARALYSTSPLWELDPDWLERIDIRQKILLLPHLLFGRTFQRGSQPYQDFDLLVRVRNDFVHYRMSPHPPRYVSVLDERSILLRGGDGGPDFAWVHKLCSSEGIRWAHNTACRMMHGTAAMIPDDNRSYMAGLIEGLAEIDEAHAHSILDEARAALFPPQDQQPDATGDAPGAA